MNSTTKYLIPFVMVALAWLWVAQCHDPNVRRGALQQQQDTRDDSTHDANERWKAEFLKRDTLRDDSLARLNTGIRVARGEIAVLKARTIVPNLVTSPDTFVAQLQIRDSIISRQDSVIDWQDAELRIYGAMLLDRDSLVVKREREIAALTLSRNIWRRAAQPNALTRVIRAAPWLVGAYILGRTNKPKRGIDRNVYPLVYSPL